MDILIVIWKEVYSFYMITESIIRRKFSKSSEYVALVLVKPFEYQKASISIVRHLTKNKGLPGVYLSVNKPFASLQENFRKNGVRSELLIFIDAITSLAEGSAKESEHCYYLESPENLSDISIAISQAVESIDYKEKFIFIDSLSTLLIYNNPETIIKFIHFLVSKMRAWNVVGIILSLKKRGESGLIAELGQFCDETIVL